MEPYQHISLRNLIKCFDNVVSIIGFALNLILLYSIIHKTSTKLKEYKPILIQNCLIDTFFSIVNMMAKTQIDQKNGNFYMYMIGPLEGINASYHNLLICFWVFSLFYCLTGVPVQFIYRYLLIVKGIKVTFITYCALLVSAFIPALSYALWTTYTFWPNEEDWNKAVVLLKADHNYDEGIPNFVVASIDEWPLKILFSYAYFLVTSVYVITIFSNIKVWRHLKAMESQMSVQARDAQRQITATLIFQAIIPCVVCLIPIGMAATMTVLHVNVPGVGLIIGLLYSASPFANPLLTLIVIKNYRNNIITVLKRICRIRNGAIVPVVTSNTLQIPPAADRGNFLTNTVE